MPRSHSSLLLAFVLAGLAGCESEFEVRTQPIRCLDLLAGGDTTVISSSTSQCAGCEVANERAAIDANLNTAASIVIGQASAGGGSLRAIAQEGVVFAEGRRAGVLVSFAEPRSGASLSIRSFLDDAQQEELSNPRASRNASVEDEPELLFYGLDTTMPFDAIEVEFSRTGADAGTESLRVHAFCTAVEI